MRSFLFLVSLLIGAHFSVTAQHTITLEDIWSAGTFSAKRIPGFNFQKDGEHYTLLRSGKIVQYNLTTGKETKVIFDPTPMKGADGFDAKLKGYTFSNDEKQLLLETDRVPIYRHSSKAQYFLYNGEQIEKLTDGNRQLYASFNPQADRVAYVQDNNLFVKDLNSGSITQITKDGKQNHIINGAVDWVYEEEFAMDRGFEWSPDGQKIAFFRFDESEVHEFTMTNYHDDLYPEYVAFKYPKVGENNSVVEVYIYEVSTGKTIKVDTGQESDVYFPRIKWTTDPNVLCVFRLNRLQNHLELLVADAKTGATTIMFEEKNERYLSENYFDNLEFLDNGKGFIWTSETYDGWHHIYHFDMNGQLVNQLTKGKWEVDHFYGVDQKNGLVYFQAAKKSPLTREIYQVDLKGKNVKELSEKNGWNDATFSTTFDYFVNTHSTASSAEVYTVHDRKGNLIRTIENNQNLQDKFKTYGTAPLEFFNFTTSDQVKLNGWMIKPNDFDEQKQYPVFMYLYGGPGSQQVRDRFMGSNYWWFQMLAQKGYIVACVDNRGTGGRGEDFKKMTYLQLGHYETIDQIEAAKYLAALPFTDANRIGIFGWSYGGYMSSLCLLKGNDVFKAAIAVAPVTNWKWYDTIYTERFMRTLKNNEKGYKDNSPVYFADRLKGNYLLIHGMGDDNVHFQHAAEMSNALIDANKQFDTYYYPNRNHGIYGGVTRLHLFQKMTSFLEEKLMNDRGEVGKSNRP